MIRQLALATLYLCCLTKCGHSFLSKWAKSPVPILSLRARMPVLHFDRSKLYDQESMYYKPSIYKVEEDPLVPVIETIVRVADQRKARQMAAFRISHLTSICTFMMIIEVLGRSQSEAIVDGIEAKLQEVHNMTPDHRDAKSKGSRSGWQAMDYDEIIIHIMSTEVMNHYQLDRKWRNAEFLDLSYLRNNKASNSTAATATTARSKEREDWSDSSLKRVTSRSNDDRRNRIVGGIDYEASMPSLGRESSSEEYNDDDEYGDESEVDEYEGEEEEEQREEGEDGQTLDPFWS